MPTGFGWWAFCSYYCYRIHIHTCELVYITDYIRKAPDIDEVNGDASMYSLVGENIYTYENLREDVNLKGIKADINNQFRKKIFSNSVFVIDARFSEDYTIQAVSLEK